MLDKLSVAFLIRLSILCMYLEDSAGTSPIFWRHRLVMILAFRQKLKQHFCPKRLLSYKKIVHETHVLIF